ncbi:MAG: phage baseplate assembly protein V [Cellvibrio sp.]
MSDDESDGLKRYYGKYRGTVVFNVDPEQRGRIMAMVPDVLGIIPSSWAMPCFPVAGKQNGFYAIPKVGDGVWIEFEQGDPNYPIWVGSFWGIVAEVPFAALAGNPADPNIVIQSLLQHQVIISDLPPAPPPPVMPPIPTTGGIILRSTTGASIVVNDAGIFLNNGKGASVELMGPAVMINKIALVVT